jgi:hypothetical protein
MNELLWAWLVGGLLPMLAGQAIARRLPPTTTVGLVVTVAAVVMVPVVLLAAVLLELVR